MIPLFVFMALAGPQTAAADNDDYEEIVVEAKVGRVALIFDKAPDGRLINCRVFTSSGVKRIDDAACTSLPDCITSKGGTQYCVGKDSPALVAVETKAKPPAALGLGVSIKPEAPKKPAVGPAVAGQNEDDPNRLGKLPPPPKDTTGTPAIVLSGPKPEEEPR
jgi:hypothetical protein